MGRYLGQWAPLGFWNFIPEQVQNLEKLVKHLKKYAVTLAISETQITAEQRGLAHPYQDLLCVVRGGEEEDLRAQTGTISEQGILLPVF